MAINPGTARLAAVSVTPPAPAAGYVILYFKTDNILYIQGSDAVEVPLGSSNVITSLTGEASGMGPGAAYVTLDNSAVIGKVLTGFVPGPNSTVLATDTILQATQKLQSQITFISGSGITSLTGDVTATGPGASAATVVSVGGSSASSIHSAQLDVAAATPSNISSTLIKRDASGDFSAGTITADLIGDVTGDVTGNVSGSASSFTGPLTGDVTGTQGSTVVSFVGSSSATNIHSAELLANASTSVNTASTIVKRDASGNFAAGTITANLTGNATNVTGIVAIVNGGTNSSSSLNNNRIMISSGGAIIENPALTAARAIVSDIDGLPDVSITTTTELSYVHGVTSPIQIQINGKVPQTRNINTTAPIMGGGDLSADLTVSIHVADATHDGYLSSTDWNTFSSTSGNAIISLTGDVTATGPGASAATVVSVGGSVAADVHSAELLANAATNLNTASTIVFRDASGDFAAGTITANLTGSASNNVLKSGDTITGILLISDTTQSTDKDTGSLVIEGGLGVEKNINAGGNIAAIGTVTGSNLSGINTGDVTETDTDSIAISLTGQNISATLKLSGDAADANNIKATTTIHSGAGAGLHVEVPFAVPVQIGTSNFVGASSSVALSDHVHAHGNQTSGTLHAAVTSSVNGFMIAADKVKLDAATNLNTASTIVFRDSSGDFSAGTITANLTGNVSGSAGSFTGSLSGDVTGTQSATLISVGAVTDTKASLANKPSCSVAATTNQALSGIPIVDSISTLIDGSLVLLTAQTSGYENGPWVIHSGAWTRPSWFPSGGTTQAFQFITILIRLGAIYQGSTWRMTTAGTITIDTTSQTWVVTPFAISSFTVTGTLPSAQLPSLTGDVTTSTGSSVTTVAFVGGSSASNVHIAELAANAATNLNTVSTIVKRDASGNFSAGTITANLTGNASGSAASFTGSLSGDVTGTQSATSISATTVTSKAITGFSSAAGTLSATDTILQAINKLDGNSGLKESILKPFLTKTGNYTILSTDSIIFVDTSSAGFILTLPSPTSLGGKIFRIIDIKGTLSTNNLTLARSSSEKIEGLASSKVFQTDWGGWHITTNGTDWFVF